MLLLPSVRIVSNNNTITTINKRKRTYSSVTTAVSTLADIKQSIDSSRTYSVPMTCKNSFNISSLRFLKIRCVSLTSRSTVLL